MPGLGQSLLKEYFIIILGKAISYSSNLGLHQYQYTLFPLTNFFDVFIEYTWNHHTSCFLHCPSLCKLLEMMIDANVHETIYSNSTENKQTNKQTQIPS